MVTTYVKKYWKLIGVVILLGVIMMSGNKGDEFKSQRKSLKNDIERLENEKKGLRDSLVYFKNVIDNSDVKEKNYYTDYVREFNRRKRAEKGLKDIRYITYNKEYLDSLKNNIIY